MRIVDEDGNQNQLIDVYSLIRSFSPVVPKWREKMDDNYCLHYTRAFDWYFIVDT